MNDRHEQQPWDARRDFYPPLADLLKSLAEADGDVTIDGTTLTRWQEIMALMREVDTKADDSGCGNEYVLNELASFERFETDYPSISPDRAPDVHEQLLVRCGQILKLGSQAARATSMDDYLHCRGQEAVHTAELFRDAAEEATASQPAFHKKAMPIFRRVGLATSYLDSAHDLPDDYEAGKTLLLPTYRHRLILAKKAFAYGTYDIGKIKSHSVRQGLVQNALSQRKRKQIDAQNQN